MTSFISLDGNMAAINGRASGVRQTMIDGDAVVQLRRARNEENKGFDWNGREIQEVKISGVLIYDRVDVACLCWFIRQGIKVDLSGSYVSPDALPALTTSFEVLKQLNITAIPGSTIPIPFLQGFSGIARADNAKNLCESISFQVVYT